jgi:hypothetical protein
MILISWIDFTYLFLFSSKEGPSKSLNLSRVNMVTPPSCKLGNLLTDLGVSSSESSSAYLYCSLVIICYSSNLASAITLC